MKIKNMIAVSGHPTLMSLVSTRNNGLILKDPTTGKTNFFAVRSHQFTPLETVGIYTMDDTAELKVVFTNMLDQIESNPPISPKSSNKELLDYFGTVLPDFDRDRVYPGDIKKVIKWFNTLKELGYLTAEEEVAESTSEEPTQGDETSPNE
jgi:hypothetical protein